MADPINDWPPPKDTRPEEERRKIMISAQTSSIKKKEKELIEELVESIINNREKVKVVHRILLELMDNVAKEETAVLVEAEKVIHDWLIKREELPSDLYASMVKDDE